MNWKLIFLLSLIGAAMGFLTVSTIPWNVEPFFWLAIFVINGFIITSNVPKGKYFAHAWFVSLVSGVWIGLIHGAMHDAYAMNHVEEMARNKDMWWGTSATSMMLMGPVAGALFGLISGLFSMTIGKIRKPNVRKATA